MLWQGQLKYLGIEIKMAFKIKQDRYERGFQKVWKKAPMTSKILAILFLQKGLFRNLNKRQMKEHEEVMRILNKK
jgi:hypothetical protein